MTNPATYTVKEVAAILRVSVDNAYASVKDGSIPSVRIGHRIVVPRAGLERMLGGEIGAAPIAADRSPTKKRTGKSKAA